MIYIGIESSCDETAIAVISDKNRVLSSKVSSQIEVHKKYGGVVPEVAAREHLRVIKRLYIEALIEANISELDIDAICVTQGPGLIGALLVGVGFAKGLARSLNKPLIPINHVHAHIYGSLLEKNLSVDSVFPALALVVSGGHTHLYVMNHSLDFNLVSSSIDDACGECFDKVAKLLGLGYPGGVEIEKLAKLGDSYSINMPKMMSKPEQKMSFSFSGLKTHMLYLLDKEEKPIENKRLSNICSSFQSEAIGQLVRKLKSISSDFPDIENLIISGGVSANLYFRDSVEKLNFKRIIFPELLYCSDNAAMIASLGHEIYSRTTRKDVFFDCTWSAYSRYMEKR